MCAVITATIYRQTYIFVTNFRVRKFDRLDRLDGADNAIWFTSGECCYNNFAHDEMNGNLITDVTSIGKHHQ